MCNSFFRFPGETLPVQTDLGLWRRRERLAKAIIELSVAMRPNEGPKKQRKAKPLLEDVSEDWNTSFARALGSVDFHTREAGVRALTVFLQKSQLLTPLAMRKLWKGLFYCFWHSDKAAAQVPTAQRLQTIKTRPCSGKLAFFCFDVQLEQRVITVSNSP